VWCYGAELTHHRSLGRSLGIATYFCDRHAPWQKGGGENAIGRLRRALPRKTNLSLLDPAALQTCTDRYNHTPRRCLGFLTPQQAFASQLLHLDCVSTPSLRSG
jgi:IS30 family transposase